MSVQEFFHMGGYGFYVWSAYGLWAVVMILNYQLSRTREKTVRDRIKQRIQS